MLFRGFSGGGGVIKRMLENSAWGGGLYSQTPYLSTYDSSPSYIQRKKSLLKIGNIFKLEQYLEKLCFVVFPPKFSFSKKSVCVFVTQSSSLEKGKTCWLTTLQIRR